MSDLNLALKVSKPKPLSGFLCVDKPVGLSTFAVVKKVGFLTTVQKVGHAGTLDPFASGLLIIALSRECTRMISKIQNLPKIYEGSMLLGKETDTLDTEGKVIKEIPFEGSQKVLEQISEKEVSSFLGKISQMPPQFSAKKVNGKRAYLSAREGKHVSLKPCNIEIFSFKITSIEMGEFPLISFEVFCSKGTYIRSLARDFGVKLNSCAYLKQLTRKGIGMYSLDKAISYEDLSYEKIEESLSSEIIN